MQSSSHSSYSEILVCSLFLFLFLVFCCFLLLVAFSISILACIGCILLFFLSSSWFFPSFLSFIALAVFCFFLSLCLVCALVLYKKNFFVNKYGVIKGVGLRDDCMWVALQLYLADADLILCGYWDYTPKKLGQVLVRLRVCTLFVTYRYQNNTQGESHSKDRYITPLGGVDQMPHF